MKADGVYWHPSSADPTYFGMMDTRPSTWASMPVNTNSTAIAANRIARSGVPIDTTVWPKIRELHRKSQA